MADSQPAPAAVEDLVARLGERWASTDEPVSKKIDRRLALCREAATALSTLAAEVQSMKADREYVIGFNAGWDEALAQANPAFTSPAAVDVEGRVARLVKPLEWKFFPQGFPPCWCAQTPFGDCVVEEEAGSDGPSYAARGTRMNVVARTEGLPEAKAAAQADYTARILSALDATALSTLAADKARLKAERDAAVARAQGMSRDANFNGSASDAWKAEAEKQKERAEKFMWQVRDTCTRAEAAEARASALEAALVKIERLGSDGEHSGDRHAQCRAIAQSALAASRKETP